MYFVAKIKWISFEKGGRRLLPKQGTRYCPLIRIKDSNKNFDWSIDFVCPDFMTTNEITFKFLVDNGPEYLTRIGEQYELYEGKRKVAKITIIKSVK